jgi:hypothetical protein
MKEEFYKDWKVSKKLNRNPDNKRFLKLNKNYS